jgi:molybdopterin-guanine dinucleotide biosynthesis protein A
MSKLPAYVLAGGKSSRFGSDKARAVLDGVPLVARVVNVLRTACDEVLAVADVPGKYADLGVETIADRRPRLGPLAGVEAALADRLDRYGPGWVVLASCDLAGLKAEWVETVLRDLPETGAVVFRGDLWQPFPAAYQTDLLPLVTEALDAGRASFQRLLSDPRAKATALPMPADWPAVPQVNTREDLDQLNSEPPRRQEHQDGAKE